MWLPPYVMMVISILTIFLILCGMYYIGHLIYFVSVTRTKREEEKKQKHFSQSSISRKSFEKSTNIIVPTFQSPRYLENQSLPSLYQNPLSEVIKSPNINSSITYNSPSSNSPMILSSASNYKSPNGNLSSSCNSPSTNSPMIVSSANSHNSPNDNSPNSYNSPSSNSPMMVSSANSHNSQNGNSPSSHNSPSSNSPMMLGSSNNENPQRRKSPLIYTSQSYMV